MLSCSPALPRDPARTERAVEVTTSETVIQLAELNVDPTSSGTVTTVVRIVIGLAMLAVVGLAAKSIVKDFNSKEGNERSKAIGNTFVAFLLAEAVLGSLFAAAGIAVQLFMDTVGSG